MTNGVPTTYTLDPSASSGQALAAGLVQVLEQQDTSGTTTYLYGITRIGEQQPGGWAYHLSDALGRLALSEAEGVRQLADGSAQVTLARGYMPYGELLWSLGSGVSAYGFTGEDWNTTIQLVFLRARYYIPQTGRFLTEDWWGGDFQRSASLNKYSYSDNNPIRYVDPSGFASGDPWDVRLCASWRNPAWQYCAAIITNKHVPERVRFTALRALYESVIVGMRTVGRYNHAPEFWAHYFHGTSALGQGSEVRLEGTGWGEWVSTHPYHKTMHDQQVDDFFRVKVWPAAQQCQTTVGPWPAGRGDAPAGPEGGHYPHVEAGYVNNDVTVAIGRHFIEGKFYADNIKSDGSSVHAQVKINRFIDDRFDFQDDDGSIPMPEIAGGFVTNVYPGIGHISHLWAYAMARAQPAWAWEYNIHIEWTETFAHEWKIPH